MAYKLYNPSYNKQPNNNIPHLAVLIVPECPVPQQGPYHNKCPHKDGRPNRDTQIEDNSQDNGNMECSEPVASKMEMEGNPINDGEQGGGDDGYTYNMYDFITR